MLSYLRYAETASIKPLSHSTSNILLLFCIKCHNQPIRAHHWRAVTNERPPFPPLCIK